MTKQTFKSIIEKLGMKLVKDDYPPFLVVGNTNQGEMVFCFPEKEIPDYMTNILETLKNHNLLK